MGGGRYDGDVGRAARSTNVDVYAGTGYLQNVDGVSMRVVHPQLSPKGTFRECLNETPIVVAMDVTRSRGDDSRVIYAKLPMFIGQIELKNYVSGAAISFAAIGDATDGDRAPLQVGQFEADNRLDEVLSKIWLEEGGGGSGRESYELAAYYYAHHTKLTSAAQGRKGFFFFLGDEGYYPTVSKHLLSSVLGREVAADVPSEVVFAELQRKFHTFLIYPRKPMEERRKDIDAEIRQRVLREGGRYHGVDIRASLIWDNTNDLDLHVIAPSGEHIYYGHKRSVCGGWLDVDMNVRGESTKPVENVQWLKGTAPEGDYQVFVQNYRFHERDMAPTRFRVELEVNGEVRHFEGVISQKGETGASSDVPITRFKYDPSKRKRSEEGGPSLHAAYDDSVILEQWSRVLPPSHILKIDDPKAIIDVMLGVLAMVGGGRSLDSYLSDMQGREQLEMRVEDAARTLGPLAEALQLQRTQFLGALPEVQGATGATSTLRRL